MGCHRRQALDDSSVQLSNCKREFSAVETDVGQ